MLPCGGSYPSSTTNLALTVTVLSGADALASFPEKSSRRSRQRDFESMVGVPASGSPLSSFAAARTRYDRCARDWRVRDTFVTTVGANLADEPISAVDAILSVHFNLALTSRLLASTDGLFRIGTGKVRCDTTRTTGDRARAGTCARGCGSLGGYIILSRSAVQFLQSWTINFGARTVGRVFERALERASLVVL